MSRSTTPAAHRLGLLGRHVSTATASAAPAPSPVTLLSDVTVSQTPGRQCAYPRAVVLADGTVIVAYVCAYPDKHSYDTYILTQRSGDGGATFEPPTVLFDGREESLAGDQARAGVGFDLLCTMHRASSKMAADSARPRTRVSRLTLHGLLLNLA